MSYIPRIVPVVDAVRCTKVVAPSSLRSFEIFVSKSSNGDSDFKTVKEGPRGVQYSKQAEPCEDSEVSLRYWSIFHKPRHGYSQVETRV